MSRIKATRAAWVLLGLGAVLGLAAGCGKDKKDGPTDGPAPGGPPGGLPGMPQSPQEVLAKLPGGDEHAAGKRVYANNNCVRCHKLGETGGGMGGPPGMPGGGLPAPKLPPGAPPVPPMPGMGGGTPDLTNVGAAAEHTKQWLAEHVRDPKKH